MAKVAVLTGGGTAGHIYPALALAERLEERGWELHYAGTPGGIEARLAPEANIPFTPFKASGFDRSRPWTLASGVARIMASERKAKRWLKDVGADVVIGFGGYVSIPVVRAAEALGVPVVVHEQNSVMGLANKSAARHAQAVCLTYDCTQGDVPGATCVRVTGNPVRAQVMSADREEARALFGIPTGATMLLVFGGSLGARHINQAVCAMKDELLARKDLCIMHISGPKELAACEDALELTDEERTRYQLMGYQDRMPDALAAADLIVSRAGATSLAEISAKGIPAILVPFPHATGDHQTTNGQAWVDSGAAIMFPDADVEGASFREALLDLVDDPDARTQMRACGCGSDAACAADRLADVVESIAVF